ncbi:MAG: transglycosylase SLT domain-containing protein [Xanthobacteraceae bacterium]
MRTNGAAGLSGAVAIGLAATMIASAAIAAPAARPRPATPPDTLPQARPEVGRPSVATRIPLPRPRPGKSLAVNGPAIGREAAAAFAQAGAGLRGSLNFAKGVFKPLVRPTAGPFSVAPDNATSAADIEALKRAIAFARKGKDTDADAAQRTIADPVARKLAEWVILRVDNTHPNFDRYARFIAENESWPHVPLFGRRAENQLWNDKLDDATVLGFFARRQPTTAKGRFVFARALLARGDREAAAKYAREAWREDDFSADVERIAYDLFGELITRADTKWRMDKRLYVDDVGSAMRAAERLGGNDLAIAKARAAVIKRAGNAQALLDSVPAAARSDPGYIFSRAEWLRIKGHEKEAAALMKTAPNDPAKLVDVDQWWKERRVLVRKLLDDGDPRTAYQVANETPSPPQDNYRSDQHFTAGWIALRYLHDAPTAARHFARIADGTDNPHALGRGGYWQGRAAEALGRPSEARKHYAMAAQFGATYYGQLARAKLGLPDLGLRRLPQFNPAERKVMSNLEIGRAIELLYKIDERDFIASIYAELGQSATDIAGMAMLCEIAEKQRDGRAMLLLGKYAYGRGLPLEYCAYPTIGLPDYKTVAPPVGDAVVYSIARQESHFNQKVVSSANAMGFMQVTPIAALDTSKRFKIQYNKARLLSDPVYNMQMGDAELSALLAQYRGSYIMTFAGYNAGRGRVRQWLAAYGDPRESGVDPIDWAERIPLAETRNYVQRIMENLQVYRYRFGGGNRLLIEADLRRDTGGN